MCFVVNFKRERTVIYDDDSVESVKMNLNEENRTVSAETIR